MSAFCVYINPPAYLAQWLKAEYWNPDQQRIEFPRGSAPRAVLKALLRTPPKGYVAAMDTEGLPVEVPTFKGINPRSFNYLSPTGKAALIGACKSLFRACLFTELHVLFEHEVQITNVIYEFMDRHNIERTEKNWETIRQMYARMRKKNIAARNC